MAVLPFEAPLWVFNRQTCYGFTQKGKTGQKGWHSLHRAPTCGQSIEGLKTVMGVQRAKTIMVPFRFQWESPLWIAYRKHSWGPQVVKLLWGLHVSNQRGPHAGLLWVSPLKSGFIGAPKGKTAMDSLWDHPLSFHMGWLWVCSAHTTTHCAPTWECLLGSNNIRN